MTVQGNRKDIPVLIRPETGLVSSPSSTEEKITLDPKKVHMWKAEEHELYLKHQEELGHVSQVFDVFAGMVYHPGLYALFYVLGGMVSILFTGTGFKYLVRDIPANYGVYLCSHGIAVGRIPKFRKPDKALSHRNRVRFYPLWEAAEVIDTKTFETIDCRPREPSFIMSDSSWVRSVWEGFLTGRITFPLKDITLGSQMDEGTAELQNIYAEIIELGRLTSLCSPETVAADLPLPPDDMAIPTDSMPEAAAQPGLEDGPGPGAVSEGPDFKTDEELEELEKSLKRAEFIRKEAAFWGIPEEEIPEIKDRPHSGQPDIEEPEPLPTAQLAREVRRCLEAAISALRERIYSNMYLEKPEKGFQAVNSLDIHDLVVFLMAGLSNQSSETAVCSFFTGTTDVTPDTVCKLRSQIQADGIRFLFDSFCKNLRGSRLLRSQWRRFHGYLLLAVDGSDLNLMRNDADEESSCKHPKEGARSYNQLHCTTIYDVLNGIYYDFRLTSKKKTQERGGLLDMLGSIGELDKSLLLADRGFESWEVLARLSMHKQKFVIRVKASMSNGLARNYIHGDPQEDFHVYGRVTFCKKLPDNPDPNQWYKAGNFSFLDEETPEYELKLRFYQFHLSNGQIECLVTNVPSWELSIDGLAEIYSQRPKIETSYRNIKYYNDLSYLHSKGNNLVKQEIYAKMTMFNFTSFLIKHVEVPGPRRKEKRKYEYAIKLSRGTSLCLQFLKGAITPETLSTQIVQRLQPIRPGRSYPRKVKGQSAKSSLYRGVCA